MTEGTPKVDPDVVAGFDRLESMANDGAAPAAAAAPGTGTDIAVAGQPWLEEAGVLVEVLANGVAPNWTVTGEGKVMIAAALAKVLNKYMPGGLGMIEQFGPWAELAAAVGVVALGNMDWQQMKLRPLKPEPEPEPEPPSAPPAPVAAPRKRKKATKKKKPEGTNAD